MTDELFSFEEKPTSCTHCGRRLVDNVCPWCERPTPVRHLHRTDSPSTSVAAAHSIKPTDLEVMVYEAIASCGSHGATADELLEMFPAYSYSSITARPAALKRKGLVLDSGRKRSGKSGRAQAVLVASKFKSQETHVRITRTGPVGHVHTCIDSSPDSTGTCPACLAERQGGS